MRSYSSSASCLVQQQYDMHDVLLILLHQVRFYALESIEAYGVR